MGDKSPKNKEKRKKSQAKGKRIHARRVKQMARKGIKAG